MKINYEKIHNALMEQKFDSYEAIGILTVGTGIGAASIPLSILGTLIVGVSFFARIQ